MAAKTGEDFEFMSFAVETTRLSGDAVKALLTDLQNKGFITPEQVMACYTTSTSTTFKTNRKDPTKKEKFIAPNLANVTEVGLVDMLGIAREKEAMYKKEGGYLKEALGARLKAQGEDALTPKEDVPDNMSWYPGKETFNAEDE